MIVVLYSLSHLKVSVQSQGCCYTTFIIRRLGWPGLQERPAAQRPGLAVAGDLGHDKDTGTRTDWRLPRLAGMRPEADLGNVNVSRATAPAQSAATTAL